jgi:heme-degrading monooxygenase HmoA
MVFDEHGSGDQTKWSPERFSRHKGAEAVFEQVWLSREQSSRRGARFVVFHLLKGPEAEDHALYASHTVGKPGCEAWTKSEAFWAAHHRKERPLMARSSQVRNTRRAAPCILGIDRF